MLNSQVEIGSTFTGFGISLKTRSKFRHYDLCEFRIFCCVGHRTSPNLLNDLLPSISRHWPSFKCFWLVELVGQKTGFIRARPSFNGEGGVAPQLWILCYRSCIAIFGNSFDNNVCNRKWSTYLKGFFKTSSKSRNINPLRDQKRISNILVFC